MLSSWTPELPYVFALTARFAWVHTPLVISVKLAGLHCCDSPLHFCRVDGKLRSLTKAKAYNVLHLRAETDWVLHCKRWENLPDGESNVRQFTRFVVHAFCVLPHAELQTWLLPP